MALVVKPEGRFVPLASTTFAESGEPSLPVPALKVVPVIRSVKPASIVNSGPPAVKLNSGAPAVPDVSPLAPVRTVW